MPIAQPSGIGAVRDFPSPSVQIVKLRKPCELDGRIDRLFEIDAFRIGRCRDARGPDAPHHIGSPDLAEHGLVVAHLAERTAPGGGGDNGFAQGIPPATLTRRPRKTSS